MEVNYYCIAGSCSAKNEKVEVEFNNTFVCEVLEAIECSEGSKIFFSKYDNVTNCPIEASCLEEEKTCQVNEDCKQPACGISECVENKCQLTTLTECRESECVDGEQEVCTSDGSVVSV